MIGESIINRRKELGITQQELANLSSISLRSIQRIENGEVEPRMHTLKELSKHLDINLLSLPEEIIPQKNTIASKLILSVGSTIVIALLAAAYLMQSARFPETTFEALLYFTCVIILLIVVQLIIWRTKK